MAPYEVIRINIDKDLDGWQPAQGIMTDLNGLPIPNVLFSQSDFEKILVIEERTKLIAKRITKWLKDNGRYSKTIIFCVDIEHAERMRRALINENQDIVSEHPNYIMKITGDDDAGKKSLDYFIDPNEKFPAIATTSELNSEDVAKILKVGVTTIKRWRTEKINGCPILPEDLIDHYGVYYYYKDRIDQLAKVFRKDWRTAWAKPNGKKDDVTNVSSGKNIKNFHKVSAVDTPHA